MMISFFARGQNLIPNPSFESINYCESNIPCSPSAWYSVGNIPYGYENDLSKPFDGKHSIAFLIAFQKEIRSYWQTMLLCNLQAGRKYIISFYLNSPNTKFESKYFGVYLSDSFFRSKYDTIITLNQSISINEQNLFLLKKGWYKITLPYIATGKEKYILLGNFNIEPNKTILKYRGSNTKFIDYYIDNISLEPLDRNMMKCTEYDKRRDSLFSDNIRHTGFGNIETTQVITTMSDSAVLSKPDTLFLSNITFNFDEDKLIKTDILDNYFGSRDISKINKIEIIGYTDSIGRKSYNLKLSERRALSVKKYLINTYKIQDSIIMPEGKGVINDDKNLEKNRRVEVRIFKR